MSPLRTFTGMGVVLAMAAAPIAAQAQANSSSESRASSRWSNDGLSSLFQQCAQGSGCVLPLKAPPAPPAPPPPPPPVAAAPAPVAPVVEEAGGFNFLPILLGLAAIGAAVFVIADDDDDDAVSP